VTASEIEDDVPAFVRTYVAQHGRHYALYWVLLWDDDAADQAGQIAEGPALLTRAEAVAPTSQAPSSFRRQLLR